MAYINSTVSILALNMTELNKIIKSQRQSDGQKNHNPTICCLQETYLRFKNTYVDNKTMEKHFLCKQQHQKNWKARLQIRHNRIKNKKLTLK